jgi:hypothetical protein
VKGSLQEAIERWRSAVRYAHTPAGRYSAADDSLRALAAHLGRSGADDEAGAMLAEAEQALTAIFEEHAAQLSPPPLTPFTPPVIPSASAPETTMEGAGPK